MSIYIRNDLEDRLKILETENTSLKNTMITIRWCMKLIVCQTYMQTVVFIGNQCKSVTTLKLRNGRFFNRAINSDSRIG